VARRPWHARGLRGMCAACERNPAFGRRSLQCRWRQTAFRAGPTAATQAT